MVSLENKIICIVGPTASGKSDLAQEIALALNGEIVSADSMQIYREMDIGTGKVIESQQRVKHYGIDLVDPGVPYSAALYQEYARRALEKIDGGGKRALLVGGRVYTYEQHLTITPFLVETMSAIRFESATPLLPRNMALRLFGIFCMSEIPTALERFIRTTSDASCARSSLLKKGELRSPKSSPAKHPAILSRRFHWNESGSRGNTLAY